VLGQTKGRVRFTVFGSVCNQYGETSVQGRLEVLQFTVNNPLKDEFLLLSQLMLSITDSLRL
jgi:hypothetical protein